MNRDTCGTCFAPSDLCKCTETHNTLVRLSNTHQQLDAALAEKSEEYELIGQMFGTYGGRWVFIPDNKHMAWPEGTAVYVRRRQA
jgi:hypothetical protein